jgi:amino acid transporter
MATSAAPLGAPGSPQAPEGVAQEQVVHKGLKSEALSLISNIVIGVASTAPAYSLAATLGLIAVAVGVLSPLIVLIAFVPMLLVSIGYSELNKADPDCGTTFTWATRTFGPWVGWYGGWAIIASDILVMASLAQVTGQYGFLLFNVNSIGHNPTSWWVLLVGVLFIALLTWVCYKGIELTARMQRVLLSVEILVLILLAVVSLVRVGIGTAPAGHLIPSASWFNLSNISPTKAITGVLLMLFIYWGWDTSVSINEETADRTRNPGLAAIIATVILLSTYFIVTLGTQAFAGVGTRGIGLANPNNYSDVFSALGTSVFGHSWVGSVGTHLLILMVLTSAAASTQTTILPTARTTLSMAAYKGLPGAFSRMHKRNMTPTVSTVAMGAVSIVLYVAFNHFAAGNLIPDAVTAIGVWIAFYYGLTGFTSAWYYRGVLRRSRRDLWMKGILPVLGGLMLWFGMFWSLYADFNYNNVFAESYTSWRLPFPPHSQVGGVFLIAIVSALVGIALMVLWRFGSPRFFHGETLNRTTPTLVPDVDPPPVGNAAPAERVTGDGPARGVGSS